MFNFNLHLPTSVEFGKGQIAALRKYIPAQARVLIVYGGGSIKRNGVFQQVIDALDGYYYREFSGVEPNPHYETLVKAVQLVKEDKLDFILAIGGGSVVDGAKFIASAVLFSGDLLQILKGAEIQQALPLGAVMTLPATGSEMNGTAVITRAVTKDKTSFRSPLVKPKFAILDPTTTFSLPPQQTANGVVDSFVHVIEQYLTYPVDAKVQDRFAEGVLLTLVEEGPKALLEPENYAVRANLMWAATMGLNGILGVGVPQDWASHAIGHELTALYGLDHAKTLAIVLPALMRHQQADKWEKLLQYANRVWHYQGSDEQTAVEFAIQRTEQFFQQMGLATHLSDYQIDNRDFTYLLDKLAEHKPALLGERKNIDRQAVLEILILAL
ncbi:iron-containing alcohol dehydrogenase [Pasteurellaceae bacterium LIM206]|nr:iron-containing alcohol dehydrogenase [Pasteurellaceae bacterium LIM206]